MKKNTSALDLHYIVKELQELKGAKVNKVFQVDKLIFFDLFKSGQGKVQLRMQVPNFLFITKYRPDFPKELGKFANFLRKRFNNAFIDSIEQKDFERIVIFKLKNKEKNFIMIVELFSKGNIIVCEEDYKIIYLLQPQSWQARTLRGGAKYEFPPEGNNPKNLTLTEFEELIKNTEKNSIVTFLAIELSLGGKYAEEICSRVKLDKDTEPKKVKAEKVFLEIKNMFDQDMKANFVDDEVFPIEMSKKGKKYKTFSEAIDETISKHLHEESLEQIQDVKESKLDKIKKIVKSQEDAIKKLSVDAEENKRKGELIFENYQEIKQILDALKEDRKKLSWKEIKEKYKGHKILKEINDKQGLILVDL